MLLASHPNRAFIITIIIITIIFAIVVINTIVAIIMIDFSSIADIRRDVFSHVMRMHIGFFETTRIGEILSRLTTDTTLVQSIAGVGLSIALRSSINLVGSLVLLAITNLKLLLLILVAIPVVIVPLIVLGRRLRKLSRSSQDRIADTSGLAGETRDAYTIHMIPPCYTYPQCWYNAVDN